MRSQINKNISKLYFYIGLKKDKDTYMNLYSNLKGNVYISEFDRDKKNKQLNYLKNTYSYELICGEKYIYLGNINTNFRELAYESRQCFNTSISKKGKGFFSFNLFSHNNIKTPYIDLILSDTPLFSNGNNQRIKNTYPLFLNQQNKEQIYIQPSAPPLE